MFRILVRTKTEERTFGFSRAVLYNEFLANFTSWNYLVAANSKALIRWGTLFEKISLFTAYTLYSLTISASRNASRGHSTLPASSCILSILEMKLSMPRLDFLSRIMDARHVSRLRLSGKSRILHGGRNLLGDFTSHRTGIALLSVGCPVFAVSSLRHSSSTIRAILLEFALFLASTQSPQ